jgi:hypothetical protein
LALSQLSVETGHGRSEVLHRHPQGDKGAEEAVGELNEARRDDQRRNLRSHPPIRVHRLSLLWRSIEENHSGQGHSILPSSRPAVSIYGPKARSLSQGVMANCRHMYPRGWFMLT